MAKRIDLTKGPIVKGVLLFALPLVIGNILQQLYTTVDTLIIGNYCGSSSLAAVGTSAQPIEVLLCLFLGIGAGVSILVSQYTGSRDIEKTKRLLKTSVFFVYACGLPLTVVGILLTPFILKWMAVPDSVMGEATLYTTLVLLGTLGNIGYNMNAGILRGLGDSKASLYFLI
ncbi:MAG: MATE family efflux transporter, partial [Spirochaetales bacterium]|nr:MATE family efflux transporter [Candidatus Physcosoma equi]